MEDIIINVEQAVKEFRETTALNNISIAFEHNKIHGLIGRNGSGKTVLLKCICGLMKLTSGEIKINGKIVGKDIQIPDNIGIIIESPGFYPNFSGYQNLEYLASIRGRIGKKEIREAPRL